MQYEDVNKLHSFQLTVAPEEGYWRGGKFVFSIYVPEDYNILVSIQRLYLEHVMGGWRGDRRCKYIYIYV